MSEADRSPEAHVLMCARGRLEALEMVAAGTRRAGAPAEVLAEVDADVERARLAVVEAQRACRS